MTALIPAIFSPRERAATGLVAGLSSVFGVVLIEALGVINAATKSNTSASGIRLVLAIASVVFIIIALYVGAIVTASTFAAVVAARLRQIGLLRLVGANGSDIRQRIAREGLATGAVGAITGALIGIAAKWVAILTATALGALPKVAYPALDPLIVAPVILVIAVTWFAAWRGSRVVLAIPPIAALTIAAEHDTAAPKRSTLRGATVCIIVGALGLAAGIIVGLGSILGLVIGLAGGLLSFSGIMGAATWILPPALRACGYAFGRSTAATLARGNNARTPARTARMTIALIIGVTLVTTFAVTMTTYQSVNDHYFPQSAASAAKIQQITTIAISVFSVLVGFSAIIAGVGMANNLSINIHRRLGELGLLRAIGATTRQTRNIVLIENLQITLTATLIGLTLGCIYGWAGAQCAFGTWAHAIFPPTIPWIVIAAIIASTLLLAVISALAPARQAAQSSPIDALVNE